MSNKMQPTFCPVCVRHAPMSLINNERCDVCDAVLLEMTPSDQAAARLATGTNAWHTKEPVWDLIINRGFAANPRHARAFYNRYVKPGWESLGKLAEILDKWRSGEWALGQMTYHERGTDNVPKRINTGTRVA